MDTSPPPANEPESSETTEQADGTALNHVVDDLEPKLAWDEWAFEEMTEGRSPDDLTVELTANGWSEDDAAELVETARRRTRHLRGVITRDDVARESASRYHRATSVSAFSAFRFVSVIWLGATAVRHVVNSLGVVLQGRRTRSSAQPTRNSRTPPEAN